MRNIINQCNIINLIKFMLVSVKLSVIIKLKYFNVFELFTSCLRKYINNTHMNNKAHDYILRMTNLL